MVDKKKNLPYSSTASFQGKLRPRREKVLAGRYPEYSCSPKRAARSSCPVAFQHFSWRQQGWNQEQDREQVPSGSRVSKCPECGRQRSLGLSWGAWGACSHLPLGRTHLETRSTPGAPCPAHLPQDHLHAPTQAQAKSTAQETELHFVATAAGSLHLANLVLAGKKERNYLDVYTQTTKKKKSNQNKTTPTLE